MLRTYKAGQGSARSARETNSGAIQLVGVDEITLTRGTEGTAARAPERWRVVAREHLLPIALYFVATIIMTYPVAFRLTTAVPGEIGADAGLCFWSLWWVAEALQKGLNLFYTRLIYYPAGVSLLFNTLNLPHSILLAPIGMIWGTIVEYNVMVLIAFVATGYTAYLLARYVTGNALAAFVAGFAFAFVPFHTVRLLGHYTYITIEFLPLAILFMLRSFDTGRRRDILGAGLCWALAGLTDWYLAVFLAVFFAGLVLYKMIVYRSWSEIERCLLIAVGVGVIAVLGVAPLAVPMLNEARHSNYMERPLVESIKLSGDLLAYVVPNVFHPLWGQLVMPLALKLSGQNAAERTLYLGVIIILLAGYGIVVTKKRSLLWLIMGLVFAVLSLGPVLHILGQPYPIVINGVEIPLPYLALLRVPFMNFTHVPARFGYMTILCADMLAALGLAALFDLVRRRWSRWRAPTAIAALVVGLLALEYLPIPVLDPPLVMAHFYHALAATPGKGAVVEVPFDLRGEYQAYQVTHQRPLVSGYLSRNPPNVYIDGAPGLVQLKYGVTDDVIVQDRAAAARAFFADNGIEYVVVHRWPTPPEQLQKAVAYLTSVLGPPNPDLGDTGIVTFSLDPSKVTDTIYARLAENWYEPWGNQSSPSRHAAQDARMVIHTPQAVPVKLRFSALSFGTPRHLDVSADGRLIGSLAVPSDRPNQAYEVGPFTLQPGDTTITFHSQEPALSPAQAGMNEDTRPITFAFQNIQVIPTAQK
jgi:hypothetical protein